MRDAIRHSERACELEPEEVFNFTALSVTFQRAFEATQDRTFIYKAEEAKAKAHELQCPQTGLKRLIGPRIKKAPGILPRGF